jgi:hypothetical protein
MLVAAVVALAPLGGGCDGNPDTGARSAPVEAVGAPLSSGEQCDTRAADVVFNGSGSIRSPAVYGRSQCFDGYLIDVNNYSARNTEGTRVSYGRVAPTTQAGCQNIRIRAFAWRKNSDGTTTFLTNVVKTGVWLTDAPSGAGRCSIPSTLLERDIPGYAPGASYRLAVRAEQITPYERQEVFVETQQPFIPLTPAEQFDEAGIVLENINSQTPGSIDPNVRAVYSTPGSARANMECRLMQLELSALRVMEPSFVRAGATAATVTRRTTTMDAIYQGHCVRRDDTIEQFQTRMGDHLAALIAMHTEIAITIGTESGDAAEVMAAVYNTEMARINAGCGTVGNDVMAFIQTGAVPAGMTGSNVLLRTCAGSPGTVQNALGLAGRPNIGQTLRSCIVDALGGPREAFKATSCPNDPRAETQDVAGDEQGGGISDCKSTRYDVACIQKMLGVAPPDPQVKQQIERTTSLENAYYEAAKNITLAEERAAQLGQSAIAYAKESARLGLDAAGWAGLALLLEAAAKVEAHFLDPDAVPTEALAWIAAARTVYLGYRAAEENFKAADATSTQNTIVSKDIPELKKKEAKSKAELCKEDPNALPCIGLDDPRKRCPEWAAASGPVWMDNGDTKQPMNMADRIESCTCEAIAAISGSFMRNGVAIQASCQSATESKKNQCIGSFTTMPNPETCWDLMQPSETDRDALRIDMCTKILCASTDKALVINGICTCLRNPTDADLATRCNFNGNAGALRCDGESGLVCDGLGARCVGFDAGRKPLGRPNCPIPTGIQLGGRNEYGILNASDVFSATFPSRPTLGGADFFMMKPGFISFVSPEMKVNQFTRIGTALRAQVLAPDVLSSGDRGSLQLTCSSPGQNIFNRFCGQKEFTNLVAGQVTNFDFTLDSSCMACLGNGSTGYRWGFGFRTPTTQVGRAGFAGIGWGGTLTTRTDVIPSCDPPGPDPSPPPIDPRVIDQLLNAGTIRPGLIDGIYVSPWNFPLSSGTTPGLIPVVIR